MPVRRRGEDAASELVRDLVAVEQDLSELRQVGRSLGVRVEALSAAKAITRAIDDEGGLVALDDDERTAVLFALEDDGGDPLLAELRGGLAREFEPRHGSP